MPRASSSPSGPGPAGRPYQWAAAGDISAFLGLTFDNVAQLIVFCTILLRVFGFPADLVLRRMLPGTAFGILVGDLVYTWLAFRLSRRTGKRGVTAMPLGIDTPSLFGLTFGVLGPVFARTHDAELAWHTGMALMIMMGLFKVALSAAGARLQRLVPPAALLGTIGAVGLLLIAFLPAVKLFAAPLVGLPALFLLLCALFGNLRLPRHLPPVPMIVALCTLLYYGLRGAGVLGADSIGGGGVDFHLGLALPWPSLRFSGAVSEAMSYLPLGLPLALLTVIGGIDTAASAAAAGDEYDTRSILLTEGVSTLLAGLAGGVIQTTPYIGHPAYKRMGARAAYTLATALFIGLGGVFGYLAWMVRLLPEVVVVPILVFIGLEITAQAFRLVPERHAPAVAASFVPVIAYLVLIPVNQLLAGAGTSGDALRGDALASFQALRTLGNGFALSSLFLGTAVTFLVDQRLPAAALTLLGCAGCSVFGLIHSPRPDSALFLPWHAPGRAPFLLAAGYLLAALLMLAFHGLHSLERKHDQNKNPAPPGR